MSRVCQLSGKRPISGSNISHAHNKTKRRFLPNLHKKRIWVQELNKYVTVKISARALRTISKNGTAELAKQIQAGAIKVR
ncbi:MAG: 50S ribosomal protein L28 [Melioribacteraceae bacterium]|nr:50S ribosomal protein L28 [Melioribacteraceae bacterium]MCF8265907.1 50S ribosomal protein L28 [Melioribacteraceae bacterium]MCF8412945.1 50S ribosomal protein L28 [Melioribacteraceae bacterium]